MQIDLFKRKVSFTPESTIFYTFMTFGEQDLFFVVIMKMNVLA